jgi:putative ABC transport system permease protein
MGRLSSWISQVAVVTLLNLRTLTARLGSSTAAVVGVAGVVAVFVAVLSIAEGFRLAMIGAGAPDVAIVMRGGSDTEMMSIMMREDARIIADAPGIRRGPGGSLASAELYLLVDLKRRSTGTEANVPLRGVQPAAFAIRDKLRIVQGRNFTFGKNEIIAGLGAAQEFQGAQLGSVLRLGESDWTVVGIFTADGTVTETEIWGDASVLGAAYRRGNSYQAVYARLTSPDALDHFKAALASDPRLNVRVVRETDYYAEQSTMLYNLITRLGMLIAGLMGIGAVFGALNTMYSAVSARTREIATLRALGFGGSPVVLSVLFEALLLALIGGALGSAGAYLAFDGYRAATINWQSFSQVTFAFAVTPALLVQGTLYSLVMGFFGGLFPAIRAARLPVAAALREL